MTAFDLFLTAAAVLGTAGLICLFLAALAGGRDWWDTVRGVA